MTVERPRQLRGKAQDRRRDEITRRPVRLGDGRVVYVTNVMYARWPAPETHLTWRGVAADGGEAAGFEEEIVEVLGWAEALDVPGFAAAMARDLDGVVLMRLLRDDPTLRPGAAARAAILATLPGREQRMEALRLFARRDGVAEPGVEPPAARRGR